MLGRAAARQDQRRPGTRRRDHASPTATPTAPRSRPGCAPRRPDGVTLALDISAPRPVIAPFAFDFRLADGAGTPRRLQRRERGGRGGDPRRRARRRPRRRRRLRRRPRRAVAGLDGGGREQGVAALAELGGGRFALRDLAAELDGARGTAAGAAGRGRRRARGRAARRPSASRPSRRRPKPPAPASAAPAPRFEAVLLLDGNVRLSGPVQDETSRAAIESFAAALFGHDRVIDDTVLDPGLPEGWPVRVLAGVEALAALEEGRLEVTGEPGLASRAGASTRDVEDRGHGAARRQGRRRGRGRRHLQRRGRRGRGARRPPAARDLRRPDQRHPRGRLDPLRRRLGRDRARERRDDRRDRRRAARLPGRGVRDRRPHRRPGPGGGRTGSSARSGPRRWSRRLQAEDLPLVDAGRRAATAPSRPIADNDTAGRPGAQPAHRVQPRPGGRSRARRRPPSRRADGADCIAAVDAILAERTLEFEAGLGRAHRGQRAGRRGDRRGAGRLPRRRRRDRRPHRRAGLGVGQPATERAARRGGARRAAGERRPRTRCPSSSPAATARPSRSPTTTPRRAGRRTAASPSRAHAGRTETAPSGGGRRGRRRHRRLRRARRRHPRRELDRVRPRLGDDRRRERAGDRLGPRGAARLPGRGARGRRLHRLRGLGLGQPAAQPAPRRGGARRAARRRPAARRR